MVFPNFSWITFHLADSTHSWFHPVILIVLSKTSDSVYGAAIMARLLREFIRFIWWMQTERQMAANPQTGFWVVTPPVGCRCPRPPSPLITHLNSGYSFYRPTEVEGWVDLGIALRVCSPCRRLYIIVAVVINTTARCEIGTLFSYTAVRHITVPLETTVTSTVEPDLDRVGVNLHAI